MTTTTAPAARPQPHTGPRAHPEHGIPRPVELREAPRPPTRAPAHAGIVVRDLGPGEEQVLDTVFAGLSDQSRYLRFHSPVPRLVPAVRRALAAVDGRRHVALVAVADGEPIGIVVRELGPGEEQVLDTVFAGLSDQSRYLRFHSPVPRLVPAVRRALAAVDGRRHVALVAVADGEPIGIARGIDLGSGRAELAIEVVDAWHGRGVGTRLLHALRERAVAAGWRELSAEVLAENDAVRALLRRVFPLQGVTRDGAELTLTLPLVDAWTSDAADLLAA